MHCIKQNADQLYRVRRGNDQPFTLVVRRSPEGYELGEGKGEQLSPEELHELSVTIYEPNSGESFTPDIRTFGDALGFELSRVHTERYGLGIYEVEVSFTLDGEGGRTLRAPLCLVVKEGAHFTAQNHQLVLDLAPIAKGERGDRGQSAYEAYIDNTDDDPKMSEAEWIRSLKSVDQRMREAKGYTDARVNDLSNSVANARENIRTGLRREADRGDADTLRGAKNYTEGKTAEAKRYTEEKTAEAKRYTEEKTAEAKRRAEEKAEEAKRYTEEKAEEAKNYARTWDKHTHTFDLRALDPNKYYAAIIWLMGTAAGIPYDQAGRFDIALYAGLQRNVPAPPYATHNNGFFLDLRWSANASGYGGRQENRVITHYATGSVRQGQEVVSAPKQRIEPSAEYVYLRGGYIYEMEVRSAHEPKFYLATEEWRHERYPNHPIPSPIDIVTPPKTNIKKEEDERNAGDVATLAGAKAYADGHLARGRSEVHDEVNILKTQIAGKMQHFIGSVVPTGYRKGDLWTLTDGWTNFKAGSVLVAGADELAGRYTPSHWQELWGFRREAKEAVDALQLGGVQLLRAPWSTAERVQDGGFYEVKLADKSGKAFELPAGTYTLSGELEVTRQGNGLMLLPTPYEAVYRNRPNERARQMTPHTGGRFSLTFTVTSSFTGFYLYPNRDWTKPGEPSSGAGVFRRLKLERGNKPSDWSPAPEDTELLIDERVEAAKAELRSEMSQQREALEARIAALEVKASGG